MLHYLGDIMPGNKYFYSTGTQKHTHHEPEKAHEELQKPQLERRGELLHCSISLSRVSCFDTYYSYTHS